MKVSIKKIVHLNLNFYLIIVYIVEFVSVPKPLKLQGSQSSTSTITIEWEGSQEGSISTTVTASWNPPSTGGLSTLTGITGDQAIISELQLNTRYHVSLYCVNIQGSSLPTSSNYYTSNINVFDILWFLHLS